MINKDYFDNFDISDDTPLPQDNRKIDEKAMHKVKEIIDFQFNWIFRPQNDQRDFGIDGLIEIKQEDKVTGKMIAVQVKGSNGKFIEDSNYADHFVYYGEPKHYYYWIGHSLPVILIFYDVNNGNAYWVHVTRENVIATKKAWKIYIPKSQKLDESAKYNLTLISKSELERKIDPLYRYREIIAYLAKGNYTAEAILQETAKGMFLEGAFVNLHVYHEDGSDVYEDYVWIEYPNPLEKYTDDIPTEYVIIGLKSAINDWAYIGGTGEEIMLELTELAKAFLMIIKFARPDLIFKADSPHIEFRENL